MSRNFSRYSVKKELYIDINSMHHIRDRPRLLLNLHFSLSVNKTNHYNSRCIIPINIKFWTVKTAYTRTIKDVSYGWKRKLTKTAQKWPKTAKSTYKNSTLKKRGKGVRRGGAIHWLLIIMPKQISDWHKWIKHE